MLTEEDIKLQELICEEGTKKFQEAELKHITSHIKDLSDWDCGAIQIWEDDRGTKLVDIEWCDGVSAFKYDKVMALIKRKGMVTKSEIVEECLF